MDEYIWQKNYLASHMVQSPSDFSSKSTLFNGISDTVSLHIAKF